MTRGPKADWETRLRIMDDIEDHPGTTRGHIARRLGLSTYSIDHHLAKLEAAYLIQRHPKRGSAVRIFPRYTDPPHTEGDT